MPHNYHLDRVYSGESPCFDGISLIQIGRMYCDKDSYIAPHIHGQLIELTVVTGGRGEIITNGISTAVRLGDIYLSLPCDTHSIVSDPNDPLRFDFLALSVADEGLAADLERISSEYHSADLRLFREERIPPLVAEAITELNCDTLYSKELLSAIFRQIMIYTVRAFSASPQSKYPKEITDPETLCYRVMNYIDTHIYSLKDLTELSAITGYSYGYLSAVFKRTTGRTLRDYHLEKKLDAARLMLLEGKLKVSSISERLGYSTLYAFSKAFKSRFGVSPKHYSE